VSAPNQKSVAGTNGSVPAAAVTATGGRDLDTKTNAMSRPTGQRFGPGMMAGGPAAKALDFKNSSRRLLRMMMPHRALLFTLLGLGVVSVTLTVIAALASFDIVYVSTQGGPGNATMVPGLEIYYLAFSERQVGMASALAFILTIILLVITVGYVRASVKEGALQ